MRNGKGEYIWETGDRYCGKWVDGEMSGKGELTTVKGDKYCGEFVSDKR